MVWPVTTPLPLFRSRVYVIHCLKPTPGKVSSLPQPPLGLLSSVLPSSETLSALMP